MAKTCALYCRVSTDKQAEKGMSLDVQVARLKARALADDLRIVETVVDNGYSAKNLNRPGIQKILELVEAQKVDCVIVVKLDRLCRSIKDLPQIVELFNRRKVALVALYETLDTSSAAGRLVMNLVTSVASWEREAASERTRDVMRHLVAQGLRAGKIPYGYTVNGDGKTLVPYEREQQVLAEMQRLRAGKMSYARIALRLNQQGSLTRAGSAWREVYVYRMLRGATRQRERMEGIRHENTATVQCGTPEPARVSADAGQSAP